MGTCSELLSTIMWSWSFIRLGLFLSKNGTAIIHSTPQSSAGNAVKRTCNLPQIKNIFSIHIMITKGNQVLQSFPFSRWTNEIWQVTSAFTSAHTAGERITQNRKHHLELLALLSSTVMEWQGSMFNTQTWEESSLFLNSCSRFLCRIIKGVIMKKRSTKTFDTVRAQ